MTKRIISLLLAALTAGSLVACTKGQKTTDEPDLPPEESAPALLTSVQGSPSSTSVSSPASDDQADPITLSEADMKLYQGSYDILHDRITDRGYAITSLTGTYVGMFTRDSSIQAMAHLSNGDPDAARAILRYLLSYHAVLGLKRGTHIVDEAPLQVLTRVGKAGSGTSPSANVSRASISSTCPTTVPASPSCPAPTASTAQSFI